VASFDFVTAFMSLMDIPETERVLAEIFKVLRPGGFLQFCISHPCFETPHRKTLRGESGRAYAREVGGYFRKLNGEVEEWLFSAVPPEVHAGTRPFRVPRFTRTLSEWLNLLIDAGFVLERLGEPRPSGEAVRKRPRLRAAQVVALFLQVRARKLARGHVYPKPAPSRAGSAERA
jgi:SAM-dependent methyltransferase